MTKRRFYLLFFLLFFTIFLTLYSTEWTRLHLTQYYLKQRDYTNAIDVGVKIIRKQRVTGSLSMESRKRMLELLEIPFAIKIERDIAIAQKEWNSSKSFFRINRIFVDRIVPLLKKLDILLEPSLTKELNTCTNKTIKFISTMMPYSIKIGYLHNDMNPEYGPLNFGRSRGGVPLDYALTSIGANLGSKKTVVAIRLRRWAMKTRVRPENLSLWISNDNKVYRRYNGEITFSNEIKAMALDQLDFTCQYLKIHCDFKDQNYTFAEDLNGILEIYGPPNFN